MRILAIGIHPDDVELGCGGTVALAAAAGHEVTVMDLSDGSASSNGTVEERSREARKAAEILGARTRVNIGLPDTAIQRENIDQLNRVVAGIRKARPDMALIPSCDDPHPDHASGGELVRRAIYLSALSRYDAAGDEWSVKNTMAYAGRNEIVPDVILDVTDTHATKMLAIKAHDSQFGTGHGRRSTVLNSPEFLPSIEARGRLYGSKIGVAYGEPFQMLNPIALKDFSVFD